MDDDGTGGWEIGLSRMQNEGKLVPPTLLPSVLYNLFGAFFSLLQPRSVVSNPIPPLLHLLVCLSRWGVTTGLEVNVTVVHGKKEGNNPPTPTSTTCHSPLPTTLPLHAVYCTYTNMASFPPLINHLVSKGLSCSTSRQE